MRRVAVAAILPLLLVACVGEEAETGGRSRAGPGPRGDGASAAPTPAPSPTPEPAFEGTVLPRFSQARAMSHVRALANRIGPRVRTTRGENLAARYVAARFRRFGYNVNVQEFRVDGATSKNVVAWWPRASRYGFVIGGHMDTVPASPGANDNASGVAAVLEVARLVAGKEQARWVRFVAFGAEEYGRDGSHHVGSTVYVSRLGERGRRRTPGMLSIDMVADGRPLIVGNSGIASAAAARLLHAVVGTTGIAVEYRTLCDCSDHGPFERAGIPAGFMYSGAEPENHTPSDLVSNLDPADLYRTGRALRAFVKELDHPAIRRLRRS